MADSQTQRGSKSRRSKRFVKRNPSTNLPFFPYGLIPLLGLLAILIFSLFPFAKGWVEEPTEAAARDALFEADQNWATPEVSGQWVVLKGNPPSEAAAASALKSVREAVAPTIFGERPPATRVRGEFDEVAQPKPDPIKPPVVNVVSPDWSFRVANGVLRLSGEVPNEETHLSILEAAGKTIDPPRIEGVTDEIIVTNEPEKAGQLDIALRGVRAVGTCERGTASFVNERFSLLCEVPQAKAASTEVLASAPLPFGRLGAIEILSSEAVQACERSLADLLGATKIQFSVGSASIAPGNSALLDAISRAAADCPGTLQIEGHTDNTGRSETNEDLSRRRAEAVRDALIQRGIRAERLIARGFGSRRPVTSNSTAGGRASNRRIEIRISRNPQD